MCDCTMTWQAAEQWPAVCFKFWCLKLCNTSSTNLFWLRLYNNLIYVKLERHASCLELLSHKTLHWKHQLGSTFTFASF